jgi:osmoprotectant transport system permease protein
MGTLMRLDSDILSALVLHYIPLLLVSLLAVTAPAYNLREQLLTFQWLRGKNVHSLARNFPLTPLLVLVAIIIPLLDINFLLEFILLTLILIIPVVIAVSRYTQLDGDMYFKMRRVSGDVVTIVAAYLLAGTVKAALVSGALEWIHEFLPDIVPALVFGNLAGLVVGSVLYFSTQQLETYVAAQHEAGRFNISTQIASIVISFIRTFMIQLHGTQIVVVFAILASALPFTDFNTVTWLAVLSLPVVTSTVLATLFVDNPPPDKPGQWRHIRAGMRSLAQISIGYLIGAAMREPLQIVYEWTQDQPDQLEDALVTHLDLTFVALGYSILIGGLGGIVSSRSQLLRVILTNLGNLGRTIPSLAVLALALPLFGIGRSPSLVAMVFIGTLPILVNTTVGIMEVSSEVKEAARGMGMNDVQRLIRVEIPVALPVIMAGVRTSAVLIVASAVLAGFIGGGGLGALIIRGDSSGREDILFTGAILATMLAVFLEYFFGWVEFVLTPRGLRGKV